MATSTSRAVEASRDARRRAVADLRRQHVLDAARAAFFELGLEGAGMREIATRAGYTAGALYSYFANKEEIYAALLGESLERLNARVQGAAAGATGRPSRSGAKAAAVATVRATAGAFFDFYRENPRDLDLGFYLLPGMQPRGLTPELNKRLNGRLRDALAPTQEALVAIGCDARAAEQDVAALFAHIVGLLMLSHTGRIRMFRCESGPLFDQYVNRMVERVCRAGASRGKRPARAS
ncbi:MAG: TetR/AcrR family transcriptional regulator [Caldimonas sp.]